MQKPRKGHHIIRKGIETYNTLPIHNVLIESAFDWSKYVGSVIPYHDKCLENLSPFLKDTHEVSIVALLLHHLIRLI
jgi:hypothetical protein